MKKYFFHGFFKPSFMYNTPSTSGTRPLSEKYSCIMIFLARSAFFFGSTSFALLPRSGKKVWRGEGGGGVCVKIMRWEMRQWRRGGVREAVR